MFTPDHAVHCFVANQANRPRRSGTLRKPRTVLLPLVVASKEIQQRLDGQVGIGRMTEPAVQGKGVVRASPVRFRLRYPACSRSVTTFCTVRSLMRHIAAMSRIRAVGSRAMTRSTCAWLVRNVRPPARPNPATTSTGQQALDMPAPPPHGGADAPQPGTSAAQPRLRVRPMERCAGTFSRRRDRASRAPSSCDCGMSISSKSKRAATKA